MLNLDAIISFTKLIEFAQPPLTKDARRKIVFHFDNATPHIADVSLDFLGSHRMRRATQPLFSPDLAPPDFYLFGQLKIMLTRSVFENEYELLDGIMRVLDRITRDGLESVFEEWVTRFVN
jgi:hypothetical protein